MNRRNNKIFQSKRSRKSRIDRYLAGELIYPDIMNKSLVSAKLFGKVDIPAVNKLVRATDNKGRKKYSLTPMFFAGRIEPLFAKKDVEATVNELRAESREQISKVA